jgi:hypothetical protein
VVKNDVQPTQKATANGHAGANKSAGVTITQTFAVHQIRPNASFKFWCLFIHLQNFVFSQPVGSSKILHIFVNAHHVFFTL